MTKYVQSKNLPTKQAYFSSGSTENLPELSAKFVGMFQVEPAFKCSCRGLFQNAREKQRKKQMIFGKITERETDYFET